MSNKKKSGHIIITGLAGSGKTTLAKQINQNDEYVIVHTDNFRYGPNWYKKTLAEYQNDLDDFVFKQTKPIIFEGALYDANDPENAREVYFVNLINSSVIDQVYVITPPSSLVDHIAHLMDRCINRVTGETEQGTCKETSKARSRLIIKNVQNYEACKQSLLKFISSYNQQTKFYHRTIDIPIRDEN